MNIRSAWIPVATFALVLGCSSKPANTIPTSAPMAAKEPHQLLPHLKYIAVRKDLKDLPVVAPQDLTALYGNCWWFHNHAGTIGLSLTQEEINELGVAEATTLGYLAPGVSMKDLQEAQDKVAGKMLDKLPAEMAGLDLAKLDKIPGEKDKAGAKDYPTFSGALERPMFNAGIYRLLKGVPAEMWNEVVVMETKVVNNPQKDTEIYLGYKGTSIMQLTARKKADGTYGLIYIYFKVHPRTLAKAVATPAK